MMIIMGFILATKFFQLGNSAKGAIAHLVFLTERYIFLRKTAYNEKYRCPCFLIDYLITQKTTPIIVITENGSSWRVGLFGLKVCLVISERGGFWVSKLV